MTLHAMTSHAMTSHAMTSHSISSHDDVIAPAPIARSLRRQVFDAVRAWLFRERARREIATLSDLISRISAIQPAPRPKYRSHWGDSDLVRTRGFQNARKKMLIWILIKMWLAISETDDRSLEAVCLFSLLGVAVSLAFPQLAAV